MNAEPKTSPPPLAALVMGGEAQKEAIAITDYIYMARDISNAYLVKTRDGDVMVNSGFHTNAARTKGLLDPVRGGPLKYIILTQSHPDHYGGVPTLREPGTKVVAERRFSDTLQYYRTLMPYSSRRSGKLWGGTVKRTAATTQPPDVTPDITVDRRYEFEVGDRTFETLSTPEGETVDCLTVWMPKEKVMFTGNLFGPVFLSMPFLVTLRGDKPRRVQKYLQSLDRVRNLGAEILITGHGEPIRGAAKIKADLDRMHAAVSYVNEQTIAGMNAGKDVYTLMREIVLPENLKIGEFHGKVSWAVRSIWQEYSGWFLYDSTTALYGVPRSSVDADLVELAGGAGVIAARARAKLDAGHPLEALHLLDVALGAEPAHAQALGVKKAALERLLEQSGGTNFSEVTWLKSEITGVDALLAPAPAAS